MAFSFNFSDAFIIKILFVLRLVTGMQLKLPENGKKDYISSNSNS